MACLLQQLQMLVSMFASAIVQADSLQLHMEAHGKLHNITRAWPGGLGPVTVLLGACKDAPWDAALYILRQAPALAFKRSLYLQQVMRRVCLCFEGTAC